MDYTEALTEQRAHFWANDRWPHFDSKRKLILECLSKGNSRLACCNITLVSKLVFDFWMTNDEEWAEAVAQAEAYSEIQLVSMITNQVPKDYRAGIQLLQMRRSESWKTLEQKLAVERAKVERQRHEANLAMRQAQELQTRAERNIIESSMWQKQFVTEEKQQELIQSLASSVNKPLLHLTPEAYSRIIEGKSIEQQLEALKGYLGRAQSTIVEEVMAGSGYSTDPDEEEENGDDSDE